MDDRTAELKVVAAELRDYFRGVEVRVLAAQCRAFEARARAEDKLARWGRARPPLAERT